VAAKNRAEAVLHATEKAVAEHENENVVDAEFTAIEDEDKKKSA